MPWELISALVVRVESLMTNAQTPSEVARSRSEPRVTSAPFSTRMTWESPSIVPLSMVTSASLTFRPHSPLAAVRVLPPRSMLTSLTISMALVSTMSASSTMSPPTATALSRPASSLTAVAAHAGAGIAMPSVSAAAARADTKVVRNPPRVTDVDVFCIVGPFMLPIENMDSIRLFSVFRNRMD